MEAGSDCGALVMPAQIDIVDQLVKEAVSKGAHVLAGGERNAALAPGQFYKPTVLCNVTHSMRIVHEEVFQPVVDYNHLSLLNVFPRCSAPSCW
jgi:acyl-CoA reductase-like NAD-dependent aldehyde dehydrogenase